jgi:hypothetical protein
MTLIERQQGSGWDLAALPCSISSATLTKMPVRNLKPENTSKRSSSVDVPCGGLLDLLQLATQAWILNRKSVMLEVQVVALDDDGLMSHGRQKKKEQGQHHPLE